MVTALIPQACPSWDFWRPNGIVKQFRSVFIATFKTYRLREYAEKRREMDDRLRLTGGEHEITPATQKIRWGPEDWFLLLSIMIGAAGMMYIYLWNRRKSCSDTTKPELTQVNQEKDGQPKKESVQSR